MIKILSNQNAVHIPTEWLFLISFFSILLTFLALALKPENNNKTFFVDHPTETCSTNNIKEAINSNVSKNEYDEFAPFRERLLATNDNLQKKQISEEFFQKYSYNHLLVKLYNETKHYGSWKNLPNFYEYNYGVDQIEHETTKDEKTQKEITSLSFVSDGYKVRLITSQKSYDGNDGVFAILTIMYHLDDVLYAEATYYMQYNEFLQLSFRGLEEFHYDKNAFPFLRNAEEKINQFHKDKEAKRRADIEDSYAGKFTD